MLINVLRQLPPRFRPIKLGSIAHIYNLHKIGNRDIVGYGRGSTNYMDTILTPMPSVRWKENHPDIAVRVHHIRIYLTNKYKFFFVYRHYGWEKRIRGQCWICMKNVHYIEHRFDKLIRNLRRQQVSGRCASVMRSLRPEWQYSIMRSCGSLVSKKLRLVAEKYWENTR